MTLLATGKPLRIYPWGNSEQDLAPQTVPLCLSLPLGFAWAQKQGGDHKHSLLLPERSFCNLPSCCQAWNGEVGEAGAAENGSLSLFNCKMQLDLWGFQYKAASGSAPPQDRGQGHDAILPRAMVIPLPRGANNTEIPRSFHNRQEKEGNKPPKFKFLSFPFIFELAFSVCRRDTDS